MNRSERRAIAENTLAISVAKKYRKKGKEINLYEEGKDYGSKLYKEEELEKLLKADSVDTVGKKPFITFTQNSVVEDMIKYGSNPKKYGKVGVLNFASARNPGGGFLGGAIAQEEGIASASDLYLRVKDFEEFYKYKKHHENGLYSNRMIYSKNISVFRNTKGELLDEIVNVDVITSPAVNVNAIKQNNKELLNKTNQVMYERIELIIRLAKENKVDTIILGAFGTGVFGNNPYKVKEIFEKVLNKPENRTAFKEIIFSIYDVRSDQNYKIFKGIRIK